MKVQCVKGRSKFDRRYGTGRWEAGEIRDVNVEIAEQLVRHVGVWDFPEDSSQPVSVAASTLDMTIAEISDLLPTFGEDDLLELLEAEQLGKTRKTLVRLIEAEIESRQ